jgi:hypothetical protein
VEGEFLAPGRHPTWHRILNAIERLQAKAPQWEGRYTISGYGGTIIVECQDHLTSAQLDDRMAGTTPEILLSQLVDEIEGKS